MSVETMTRKRRSDAGIIMWTERDIYAVTWIGQQYAIRLDHLQVLLGLYAGSGTALSMGGTRKLVARWKRAGWVEAKRLRASEPLWVWPTRLGLRQMGLPYVYRNMEQSLDDLTHLAAINEIRLYADEELAADWMSERQLFQEVGRISGKDLLHRPDALMQWSDGDLIAIEAELSLKKPMDLAENLMELVRGRGYLRLKTEHGAAKARTMSQGMKSKYNDIWYFGPPKVRRQVRRVRAHLVEQGALSEEEAKRIFVKWYPLARTKEAEKLEDREDDEALNLAAEEDDEVPV
ncbi:hypothetical protein C5B42_01380 [Candidatus Cerribacteria bacterium 'Amazon FNV 2010 28 9']|uniref:Uncharacterized protein n=1 Tax=Candidatus Cerribacteria bacterium 'Amazon FNV 2010 28 9' TaxID=2081795 RepID=A0A317JR18_9BACT|nr:MAG: hypothetical protein C5B42_01380 [Candidatus Cerribacteria bacterium 'Amazon FNV 2010 28 9']